MGHSLSTTLMLIAYQKPANHGPLDGSITLAIAPSVCKTACRHWPRSPKLCGKPRPPVVSSSGPLQRPYPLISLLEVLPTFGRQRLLSPFPPCLLQILFPLLGPLLRLPIIFLTIHLSFLTIRIIRQVLFRLNVCIVFFSKLKYFLLAV